MGGWVGGLMSMQVNRWVGGLVLIGKVGEWVGGWVGKNVR